VSLITTIYLTRNKLVLSASGPKNQHVDPCYRTPASLAVHQLAFSRKFPCKYSTFSYITCRPSSSNITAHRTTLYYTTIITCGDRKLRSFSLKYLLLFRFTSACNLTCMKIGSSLRSTEGSRKQEENVNVVNGKII
jgi:hypothetical protein